MRTYYWLLVFIGCLGVENGISQSSFQLGLHYSMGRTFTQIDYSQATSENLGKKGGLAVPLGLEFAWIATPHLQISSGVSITPYVVAVQHPLNPWRSSVDDNFTLFQIPLDLSYRLFDQRSSRKNILFIMGASYNLTEAYSGATGGSSRNVNMGVEEGSSYWMPYRVRPGLNFSLRWGLGQETKIGKQDRWALQIFALYNQGVGNIWEADFYMWDESFPDDVRWPTTYPDVMPEPIEFYDLLTSSASYFTVGFKLMYTFKRRNPSLRQEYEYN